MSIPHVFRTQDHEYSPPFYFPIKINNTSFSPEKLIPEEKMGYKPMKEQDVYNIFRRYHAGETISIIECTEMRDRKTIRFYIEKLKSHGFTKDKPFPDKEMLYQTINSILPKIIRPKKMYNELEQLQEKVLELIHDNDEPVKPKTAYEILKKQGKLNCSYPTFKRFMREKGIKRKKIKAIIRIELPPGDEAQLDYGKMGRLEEKKSGKKKTVYAFISVLSHSRHRFIQFAYKQNTQSFTDSVIDSFEYYGGVTKWVSIDNLKAGVIIPDLYDPKLNRSLQDAMEYYETFINPCRVGKSTDKGKVERGVPGARELFRKLKILHPDADLNELNKHALIWCKEEYGKTKHGTTNLEPIQVFEVIEKQTLKTLPEERFNITVWKEVKVHPDQFIQFEKKRYGLPEKYRGAMLWAKKQGNMVYIYSNYQLIKQFVVPEKHYTYDPNDFPEVKREMMEGNYPKYLLKQAKDYGESAYQLIEQILTPHAYLNARRAQGIIEIMKSYQFEDYFNYVCERAKGYSVTNPKIFKKMLEQESQQQQLEFKEKEISELGKSMTRPSGYYLN